jgi:hypothetical protein
MFSGRKNKRAMFWRQRSRFFFENLSMRCELIRVNGIGQFLFENFSLYLYHFLVLW